MCVCTSHKVITDAYIHSYLCTVALHVIYDNRNYKYIHVVFKKVVTVSGLEGGPGVGPAGEDLITLEAEITELQRENARVESQMLKLRTDITAMEAHLRHGDKVSIHKNSRVLFDFRTQFLKNRFNILLPSMPNSEILRIIFLSTSSNYYALFP